MEVSKYLELLDLFIEDSPELRHLVKMYLRENLVLL
jgi:hypothetical protein